MNAKLYRCGFCGMLTDKDGQQLDGAAFEKARKIHEQVGSQNHTHQLEGSCCNGRVVNEAQCPSCYGSGTWEAECCNGSGGCSCRGQAVNMGRCHVCNGSGKVTDGNYNARANSDFILRSGCCFLGSGPSSGYWANTPAMGII